MICRHSLALFFLARKDGMLPPASSLRASAPRCNSMLSQHDGERRGKEEGGGEGSLCQQCTVCNHLISLGIGYSHLSWLTMQPWWRGKGLYYLDNYRGHPYLTILGLEQLTAT